MKIVVSQIPDDMQTDNEEIKALLERRKKASTNQERIQLSHEIIVVMGREFFDDIENNEELLKKLNMSVIPGSSKHKKKTNGYEADHIKFLNTDEIEYTLEMQFKSGYVENKTMGSGSASHENRRGKERILPNANTDEELKQKLEYMCPKCTLFRKNNGKYEAMKLSMLQNVMSYYQEQISVGSDEYEKIYELYTKDDKKNLDINE